MGIVQRRVPAERAGGTGRGIEREREREREGHTLGNNSPIINLLRILHLTNRRLKLIKALVLAALQHLAHILVVALALAIRVLQEAVSATRLRTRRRIRIRVIAVVVRVRVLVRVVLVRGLVVGVELLLAGLVRGAVAGGKEAGRHGLLVSRSRRLPEGLGAWGGLRGSLVGVRAAVAAPVG